MMGQGGMSPLQPMRSWGSFDSNQGNEGMQWGRTPPRRDSEAPARQARGDDELLVPEARKLDAMRACLEAEVESAARELDEILGGGAGGGAARARLAGVKARIQTLLLPMAASQGTYLSSVVAAYSGVAGGAGGAGGVVAITPVKRLKIMHVQRVVEGRARELRDLVQLCDEFAEQVGEDRKEEEAAGAAGGVVSEGLRQRAAAKAEERLRDAGAGGE
ncbi:hypothetical protein T484DRAFT_1884127 [Baffinella frigidus]|nr:hypothetical protein T484DRAFT_1884127 [Cryptophyta sp. CCMP2293]